MPLTVLEIIMDHTRAQKVATSHSEREKNGRKADIPGDAQPYTKQGRWPIVRD